MKANIRNFTRKFTAEIIMLIAALGALLIAAPSATEAKYAKEITTKEQILNKNKKGVVLYDRNGKQVYSFYEGKTDGHTPLTEISEATQRAVIAAEDENFYNHNGVSVSAIAGALFANLKKGDIAYGGSTITQQLTKNTILNSERNLFRKYEEFILAQKFEKQFSKEEILEMYLNTVYFGEGAYGVEEAALVYFNKKAKDLDISEASMLAGIIAAPSTFSPVSGDANRAKSRQISVLDELVEEKYIDQNKKELAAQKNLVYTNGKLQQTTSAPHFALLVKEQLIKQYGEQHLMSSGMKVYTTIDLNWQSIAEQAVKEQVQKLAASNGSNAGVVVIDPKTGEVRAMVGSADWQNQKFGKVNMAVSPRQPGSAFKPIVYLSGFEKQTLTPSSILIDVDRKFENNYKPKNYDRSFRGPVTARYALANSLNVPAVEVMTQVGTESGLEMAKRLGITTLKTPSHYGPSLVLGTGEVPLLELTNAYATLANKGEHMAPVLISSIQDKHGKEIMKHQPKAKRVVDEKYVFLVSSILSDKKARTDVFGSELDISRPAAVKTGTTENYKDAWTMGYTPSLAVGVWVGNNDNTTMDRVAGSLGAAPVWKNVMEKLTAGTPVEQFTPPSGVIAQSLCANNPKRSFKGDSVDTEYFAAGTENKACQPLEQTRFLADDEVNKALSSLDGKNEENKDEEEKKESEEQRAVGGTQDTQPQPTSPPEQNIEQEVRRILEETQESNNNGNGRGRGNGNGRGNRGND